jgi:phosphotransferase system  glucose/maltose/N-acetylglucosamine-specific IIC component
MNVTKIIDAYANLGANSRILISLGLGILVYIGLRILIKNFNKEAKRLEEELKNKKKYGSYWERMEKNARTQMS